MPRCDGSGTCSCVIHAGRGMSERGSGTAQDPLYLDVVTTNYLGVVDTSTIDLTLEGDGSDTDPRILSANLIAKLSDLVDVTTNPPQIGNVLGWNGIEWAPQPNATAEPGAILSTGGVTVGDGSAGNPLRTAFLPRDFLSGTSGLELSSAVRGQVAAMQTSINAEATSRWTLRPYSALTTGGTITPSTPMIFEAGTAVMTSNSDGIVKLNFTTPFPNGLLTFVEMPGDYVYTHAVGWQGYPGNEGFTRAFANLMVLSVHTGQPVVNAAYRSNFIAIGW